MIDRVRSGMQSKYSISGISVCDFIIVELYFFILVCILSIELAILTNYQKLFMLSSQNSFS